MTPRATDFAPVEAQRAPKKKRKKKEKKIVVSDALEQINLDAAGIDIGAGEHAVAVPSDRDEVPVRCFGAFTLDLFGIANWLESCGIRTVAMESTGVFWIPLMEVLEERGFEVLLVDPHKLKNVSGRKSDMLDCQWIQQLHTYGLLRGAFRPSDEICALRSYARQRAMLIRRGADHVQHMQKAMTQMNVKLTMVLKDITGKTGMQIIRSILAGERDPKNDTDRTAKAFFVPVQEIRDKKYDLSINRYKETVYEEVEYDPPKMILQRLRKMEDDIRADLNELEAMLR